MSHTQSLTEYISDALSRAIGDVPDELAGEIYALSFWVYSDEDDPRHPVLEFSYNTFAQIELASPNASNIAEAKWNFAF